MTTWRYIHNGQTFGPVELVELQRLVEVGILNKDSMLQPHGATVWVPASSIEGLNFPAARPTAAEVPPKMDSAPSSPPLVQSPDASREDIEKNRVFAILAYISILFIVPLLAAPESKFARYHANQGMVLFLATVILMVGSMVLMMIPFMCFMWVAPFAIVLGSVVLMVLGIVNAAAGECKPLPLIGHFQLLK